MATDYVINTAGSTTMSYPDASYVVAGDSFRFNITNTTASTAYLGYYIDYTFPFKCKVMIGAAGARGAYGNLYTYGLTSATRSGYGAIMGATFTFEKGDQLLMLVGQHGRDAMTSTSSTRNQTTGAGGGATYVAKRVSSSNYLMVGTSTNGSTAYSGWYLEPLLVAAGGNGSRDNGSSGTGTIYDGLGWTSGTTEALGASSTSYYVGGTFSRELGSVSSNSSSYTYGRSFLQGGLGSMYRYTRTTYSIAGFGGGGSNQNNGNGGGGGGWVSGYINAAARSYINTTLGTDPQSLSGSTNGNNGDGIVLLTFLEIYPQIYVSRGTNTVSTSNEQYVYVNDSLGYKRIKEMYVKNSSGVWVRANTQ